MSLSRPVPFIPLEIMELIAKNLPVKDLFHVQRASHQYHKFFAPQVEKSLKDPEQIKQLLITAVSLRRPVAVAGLIKLAALIGLDLKDPVGSDCGVPIKVHFNAYINENETLFHLAARAGDGAVLRLLVTNGASECLNMVVKLDYAVGFGPGPHDMQVSYPLDFAVRSHNPSGIAYLLSLGGWMLYTDNEVLEKALWYDWKDVQDAYAGQGRLRSRILAHYTPVVETALLEVLKLREVLETRPYAEGGIHTPDDKWAKLQVEELRWNVLVFLSRHDLGVSRVAKELYEEKGDWIHLMNGFGRIARARVLLKHAIIASGRVYPARIRKLANV